MNTPLLSEYQRTTKTKPCPICERPDWCLIARDGTRVICARVESGKPRGEAGFLHILEERDHEVFVPPHRKPPRLVADFDVESFIEEFREALTVGRMADLTTATGLSEHSLRALMVGWNEVAHAYAFPMRDSDGRFVGIRLRALNGEKWAIRGSRNGLFIPAWVVNEGPLLICEGPTDTAAAMDLGFAAVGLPGAGIAKKPLQRYLAVSGRDAILVSDRNELGSPADLATKRMVEAIREVTRVKTLVPPCKDIRAWLNDGATHELVKDFIGAATWQEKK